MIGNSNRAKGIINKAIINKILLAATLGGLTATAQALPTHEVIFEQGGDCGHYEGDLTGGTLFTLQLTAGQQLVVSTDGHVQSVTDSKGAVLIDQGGANYRYTALNSGTHQVKIAGRSSSTTDFCIDTRTNR